MTLASGRASYRKKTSERQAKKEKNFAEADRFRDELKAMGVEIIDTPQGAKWRKV